MVSSKMPFWGWLFDLLLALLASVGITYTNNSGISLLEQAAVQGMRRVS